MITAGDQYDLAAGLLQPGADAAADRSGADDDGAGHALTLTFPARRGRVDRLADMSTAMIFALILVAGVIMIGLLAAVWLVMLLTRGARPAPDS
jgi:hypothetical protein